MRRWAVVLLADSTASDDVGHHIDCAEDDAE